MREENCSKMDITYKAFFGLKEEPFRSDLKLNNILQTENLKAVKTRFDYTVRVGGAAVVTGEIGSGKTTALRYASEVLHPSEYRVIYITATSGPILELYRQVCTELAIGPVSRSKAAMTRIIKKEIKELKNHTNFSPDFINLLRIMGQFFTINPNLPTRWCFQMIYTPQQCRFSRAAGTNNNHNLAAFNIQVYSINSLYAVKMFIQVLYFDDVIIISHGFLTAFPQTEPA